MAVTITRGTTDPKLDEFVSALEKFQADHPSTEIGLYRHGKYSVRAFVNNIENADIVSNDGLQSISIGQQLLEPDNYVYYPPRTVGFRFGVNL